MLNVRSILKDFYVCDLEFWVLTIWPFSAFCCCFVLLTAVSTWFSNSGPHVACTLVVCCSVWVDYVTKCQPCT